MTLEKKVFSPGSYWLFDSEDTVHVRRKIFFSRYENAQTRHPVCVANASIAFGTLSAQRRDRRSGGDSVSDRKSGGGQEPHAGRQVATSWL